MRTPESRLRSIGGSRRALLAAAVASATATVAAPLLLLAFVGMATPFAWSPRAQGGAATATSPITALLLSRQVGWNAEPGEMVEFQLIDGEAVVAVAQATASSDGSVIASFPSEVDSLVRPGRVIWARALSGGQIVSDTVPPLSVVLDEERRQVLGTAHAGALLEARVDSGNVITTSTTTADVSGHFTLSLPAAVDGELHGDVTLSTGSGRFHAAFEEITAHVGVGTSSVHGHASRGSRVRAWLSAPTGGGDTNEYFVEGGTGFTLTMASQGIPRAILPGSLVTIRESGTRRLSGVTPPLSVSIVAGGVLSGSTAPRRTVQVALSGPEGHGEAVVTAGVNGEFSADFSDRVVSLPGTRATASSGERLTFDASAVAQGALAPLYGTWVTGVVTPNVSVRLTLLDVNGRLLGSAATAANADGAFRSQVVDRNDRPLPLEPGTVLLVSSDGALPERAVLPSITAFGSPADDDVVGIGPPGSPVAVTAAGSIRRVQADETGVLIADFGDGEAPESRLSPGQVGSVILSEGGAIVIRAPWIAPLVSMDLGGSAMRGVGVPGRPITVAVTGGGFPVGIARTRADESTGSFAAELESDEGAAVPVLAGDHVALELPGWWLSAQIPALAVEANPVTDRITGSAPPGEEAFVAVLNPDPGPLLAVRPDAAGRFATELSGRVDLLPGATLRLSTLVLDTVEVATEGEAVRAVLELDSGSVRGATSPRAAVDATLTRAGFVIADASTRADAFGAYTLTIPGTGGGLPLAKDDTLAVSDGAGSLHLIVPDFSMGFDPSGTLVSGRAPPATGPSVQVAAPWHGAAGRRVSEHPGVAPSGAFTLTMPSGRHSGAGSTALAQLDLQPGVAARRRAALPYLDLQRGGSVVRGVASSGGEVRVEARRGTTLLADATDRAAASGVFAVVLASPDGEFRLQPGDDVTIEGVAASTAQAVALDLAAPDRRASGVAPPLAVVDLMVETAGQRSGPMLIRADERGVFAGALPGGGPMAPGSLVEAGTVDGLGHRTFSLDAAPNVVVRVGSPEVRGRDAPFSAINVRHVGPAGGGGGTGRADTFGAWSASLAAPGGPVAVQPGDTLQVSGAGGREIALEVPELSVAVDEWGRARGRAPASAVVTVRVTGPGTPFDTLVRAGQNGAWSLDLEAIHGVPPFPLAETDSALAWITTAQGHRVEAFARPLVPTATPVASPTSSATQTPTPLASGTATATPSPSAVAPPSATPARPTVSASSTPTPTAPAPPRCYLPIEFTRR